MDDRYDPHGADEVSVTSGWDDPAAEDRGDAPESAGPHESQPVNVTAATTSARYRIGADGEPEYVGPDDFPDDAHMGD